MKKRGKSELETLAKAKAKHLDGDMLDIESQAQYLADGMNVVLSKIGEKTPASKR